MGTPGSHMKMTMSAAKADINATCFVVNVTFICYHRSSIAETYRAANM